MRALQSYLSKEHKEKKGTKWNQSGRKKVFDENIPLQENEDDCGVFICKFAEFCSRRAIFTFHQTDMPDYRKKMTYEIVNNELMFI